MTHRAEIITAYDRTFDPETGEGGVIGVNNRLPWHLPGDLAHYKQMTLGRALIMGAATRDSLPPQAFEGRTNIMLSRTREPEEKVLIARDMEEALEIAQEYDERPAMVIGGAQVYKEALPYVDRIYATEVEVIVKGGGTRFPIDLKHNHPDWIEEAPGKAFLPNDKNRHIFSFVTYIRRNPTQR